MKRLLTRAEIFGRAKNNPGMAVSPCGCMVGYEEAGKSMHVMPGADKTAVITCALCGTRWEAKPGNNGTECTLVTKAFA